MPWLALVAAPVGIFLVLRTQRDALRELDWSIPWHLFAAAALTYALAPLMQGFSFWLALRLLSGATPLLDGMLVWARSYVVRYAPTGALAIAYRVSARGRLRASADQVLSAYAYEHVASLAAGAALCLALFSLAGERPPLLPLGIAVAVLVLTAALRPGVAGRATHAIARRLGIELAVLLGGRQLVALVGVNMVGWLGTCAAVQLLVTTVTGSSPGFLWLMSTYTAGYLVGFVTPLAPGGLGAREGMLVMLLAPRYGTAAALGISLLIRVANVAGELAAVALVHIAAAARSLTNYVQAEGRGVAAPPLLSAVDE